MGLRIVTTLDKLSSLKLEKVRHCLAVSDYQTVKAILESEGYTGDEGDDPKVIGAKVKKYIR